jgi:hypothetical protein
VSHISTFVSRRFEELHAILNASGYLLDFSGREHPRWEDEHPLPGAQQREGLYLRGYSYHGQAGNARLRYEFDPDGHPESPYHLHPPGAPDHVRQPAQAIAPETALSDLAALIATERAAGRL